MKLIIKSALLIILAVLFFVVSNCEKSQIYDSVNTGDVSSIENQRMSKEKADYTCYGYAVEKALLEQYSPFITQVPEKEFSTTDTKEDAILVEWQSDEGAHDHGAYKIGFKMYDSLHVDEYAAAFNPHAGEHTYPVPYDHPLSDDDNVVWWEKDPPDMTNEITGPTSLDPSQTGEFTANPDGGAGTYKNYEWWRRNDGDSKEGGTKEPPVGQWWELEDWEGYKTIEQKSSYNFSLKCRATCVWNYTAEDIHSVTINDKKQ